MKVREIIGGQTSAAILAGGAENSETFNFDKLPTQANNIVIKRVFGYAVADEEVSGNNVIPDNFNFTFSLADICFRSIGTGLAVPNAPNRHQIIPQGIETRIDISQGAAAYLKFKNLLTVAVNFTGYCYLEVEYDI